MPDLHHLTLTTGDVRVSPRSEVTDGIVAHLSRLCLAGGGTIGGLTVTIEEGGPRGAQYTLGWDPRDVWVRCVLCADDTAAARWWDRGLELARTSPARLIDPATLVQPPRPWLAVALLAPALTHEAGHDRIAMLGDAERCVAWALLESV